MTSRDPAPVVLCAPDKLRGALAAAGAAEALATGVRDAGGRAVRLPVADGGEGTLDALVASGVATPVAVRARDAHGRWTDARIAVLHPTGPADGSPDARGTACRPVDVSTAGPGERRAAPTAVDGRTDRPRDDRAAPTPVDGRTNRPREDRAAPTPVDGRTNRPREDRAAPTPVDGRTNRPGDDHAAPTPVDRRTDRPGERHAGPTVLVEAAEAIGLAAIPAGERDVGRASSAGVGDLVRAALDRAPARILVAVGGSASVDGGAGFLRALGVAAPADGAALVADPTAVDGSLTGLDPRLADIAVELLHDVDAPLCGPRGAARVFGPQKGASPAEVDVYDAALRRWARALRRDPDVPGSGAAGGLGLALLAIGATARPGAAAVLGLVGFDASAAAADLVLTAEGSVDASTLQGKTVDAVVARATSLRVPVVVLGGRVEDAAASMLRERGARAVTALGPPDRPTEDALAAAAADLRAAASRATAALRPTADA